MPSLLGIVLRALWWNSRTYSSHAVPGWSHLQNFELGNPTPQPCSRLQHCHPPHRAWLVQKAQVSASSAPRYTVKSCQPPTPKSKQLLALGEKSLCGQIKNHEDKEAVAKRPDCRTHSQQLYLWVVYQMLAIATGSRQTTAITCPCIYAARSER